MHNCQAQVKQYIAPPSRLILHPPGLFSPPLLWQPRPTTETRQKEAHFVPEKIVNRLRRERQSEFKLAQMQG